MLDVLLYEADGVTLVGSIRAERVRIDVDATRFVRRTATFEAPIDHLPDLRVMGRIVRITDSASGRVEFTGYVDDIAARVDAESGTASVSCRDKAKRLREAAFVQDVTFADPGATDTGQLVQAVSASSSLTAGSELQGYADVYDHQALILLPGTAREEAPISGDIRDGTLVVEAPEGAPVELVSHLDLKAPESLSRIDLQHDGTSASLWVSIDGVIWIGYVGGSVTCRYIRATIRGQGRLTAGIRCIAAESYPASNVLQDDEASWRPGPFDMDRTLTLDLGSAQPSNGMLARWGLNDAERRALYRYAVEYQDGTGRWRQAYEGWANAGLAEAAWDPVTARYWRIRILGAWHGRPALRYVQIHHVEADDTVDQVIRQVAEAEGETDLELTPTRQRVSVTFEAGASIWESLQRAVHEAAATHELFYAPDGALTFRPRIRRTDEPRLVRALLPPFEATYSDADVRNEIVAVHEAPDQTLRHEVRDDNAVSPTSIPRIGRRTEVVRAPLADTPEKLRTFAQRALAERTRVTLPATARIAAGEPLDVGDVWRIVETRSGTDGLFVVHAYTLSADLERATYDVDARVEAI